FSVAHISGHRAKAAVLMRVLFLILGTSPCLTLLAADYDSARFEKEIIVPSCNDPVQCEITSNGRLFFIERAGALNVAEPQSKKVTTLGQVPVEMTWEVGLLGFALDRDFARSQALYLFFSPQSHTNTMRLARFTLKDGLLDLAS